MKPTSKNQFSLSNALLLVSFIFVSIPLASFIIEAVPGQLKLFVILFLSILIGLSISWIILIKQMERQYDKWFYILTFLISLFMAFMFVCYYLGIII